LFGVKKVAKKTCRWVGGCIAKSRRHVRAEAVAERRRAEGGKGREWRVEGQNVKPRPVVAGRGANPPYSMLLAGGQAAGTVGGWINASSALHLRNAARLVKGPIMRGLGAKGFVVVSLCACGKRMRAWAWALPGREGSRGLRPMNFVPLRDCPPILLLPPGGAPAAIRAAGALPYSPCAPFLAFRVCCWGSRCWRAGWRVRQNSWGMALSRKRRRVGFGRWMGGNGRTVGR
jgi:hypothetical protein